MLETPGQIFIVMEKMKGDMVEMILSAAMVKPSTKYLYFIAKKMCQYVFIRVG